MAEAGAGDRLPDVDSGRPKAARVEAFVIETLDGPVPVPDPRGERVLIMFFQEAETPTCATQLRSLCAEAELLQTLGAISVAISTDAVETLRDFRTAATLHDIHLASDSEGELARRFGVYDAGTRRAQRAAFVVDADGAILHENHWYNPMVGEHLLAVFEALGLEAG